MATTTTSNSGRSSILSLLAIAFDFLLSGIQNILPNGIRRMSVLSEHSDTNPLPRQEEKKSDEAEEDFVPIDNEENDNILSGQEDTNPPPRLE
jgi:hypothetical protein